MNDDDFEWDQSKARRNYTQARRHLRYARKAFADPFMVEVLDDSEERFLIIVMADGHLLSIVYTPRQGRFRLISARRATKDEQDHYFTQNSQGEA